MMRRERRGARLRRTGPEGGLGLLVHLPDVVVLDGEHREAVDVLIQERLRDPVLGVSFGDHLCYVWRMRV